MPQEIDGKRKASSPYSAVMTREQFLFHETRITAKLLDEGLEKDEIIKNIVNYFIKSDREFLDFESETDMKYFMENKTDLLYKKIYIEKYDEIIKKYDIKTN